MPLDNGTYIPNVAKSVLHWPAPDANGVSEPLFEDQFSNGEYVGRMQRKDVEGNAVRDYPPPDGVKNFPSYDNTDCWVEVDGRGQIVRQPDGQSVVHKPGRTVVKHADGSATYLDDDFSRYQFDKTHSRVGE